MTFAYSFLGKLFSVGCLTRLAKRDWQGAKVPKSGRKAEREINKLTILNEGRGAE